MAPRPMFERLLTERPNRASRDLDRLSPVRVARLMNREDRRAVAAVGRAAPRIAAAVALVTRALASGGRPFFAGPGAGRPPRAPAAAGGPAPLGPPAPPRSASLARGPASGV